MKPLYLKSINKILLSTGWLYVLLATIHIFCLGWTLGIEKDNYEPLTTIAVALCEGDKEMDSEFNEWEGIIMVLAVDGIDPLTGKLKGKFIHFLQTEKGERFILEPFSDASPILLQPSTKVKVIGIKRDGKIYYKKIAPMKK